MRRPSALGVSEMSNVNDGSSFDGIDSSACDPMFGDGGGVST